MCINHNVFADNSNKTFDIVAITIQRSRECYGYLDSTVCLFQVHFLAALAVLGAQFLELYVI